MTEQNQRLTLYVDRIYKYGELIKTFYGLEGIARKSGERDYWIYDDFIQQLLRRSQDSDRELVYRNFNGSEVRVSKCSGCLLTTIRSGLSSQELGELAEQLSTEFEEDKERCD